MDLLDFVSFSLFRTFIFFGSLLDFLFFGGGSLVLFGNVTGGPMLDSSSCPVTPPRLVFPSPASTIGPVRMV